MNLLKDIKREIFITVLTIIGLTITFFGVTYAIYFTIDEKNIGTVGVKTLGFEYCADQTCSTGNTTMGTTITGDVYPMNTTEGLAQTPYLFKLSNNGGATNYAEIYAAREGAASDYANVKIATRFQGDSSYTYSNLSSSQVVTLYDDIELDDGDVLILEVYVWLDEEASNSMIGKTISIFINAMSYYQPSDPNGLHTGDTLFANSDMFDIETNYPYSSSKRTYTVPATGYYYIEAYGPYNSSTNGSMTSGYVYMEKDEKLYVYTGNSGTTTATDVRYFTTEPSSSDLSQSSTAGLNARIMSASYGGGGYTDSFMSGYAGTNAVNASGTATNNTLHYTGKYFINGNVKLKANSGAGKVYIKYVGVVPRTNTKLNNVRYVKDCMNGSPVGLWNSWVEIEAIKDGTNIAKGITPLSGSATTNANLTDGDVTTYYSVNNTTGVSQCITIDLGSTQNLDEIGIWHYHLDERTYFSNITYVSSDNSSWTEVLNETKVEDTKGRRVNAYSEPLNGYIQDGLLVLYDGLYNTTKGRSTSTTTWTNLVSSSYNGTITSGTWGDKYLTFNGSSTWVSVGQIDLTSAHTIDVIFKQGATATGYQDLVANWQGGGFGVATKNNNFITCVSYGGSYVCNNDSVALGTSTIYSYTSVFNQTSLNVYKSGKFVQGIDIGGLMTAPSNSTVVAIGADPNGSSASAEFWNGNVYLVRIYNRALTDDEIYHNYLIDKERYGIN